MKNPRAYEADLQMIVDQLEEKLRKWTETFQEEGAGWTPEQEKKWEGAWMTLRGVLVDDLGPCLRAWKEGCPFSREGERLEAEYDPEIDSELGGLRDLNW